MANTSIKKSYLTELQTTISKMSLHSCSTLVVSEFGLNWCTISRAIRNARLPMTPASVASILKKHAVKSFTQDEIGEIVSRLRLKSIAIKPRTWHVITLSEKVHDEQMNVFIKLLPTRIVNALKGNIVNADKKPQVQILKMGDLIYISVQMLTKTKEGPVLYVAYPPAQDVVLVSTLHSNLLRACMQGLGYKKFEDAQLNGKDIPSLLRIIDSGTNTANVANLPAFVGAPRIVRGGIDFTNRHAAKEYLSQMFGPSPPILDTLTLQAAMDYWDPNLLNKKMKMTLKMSSSDTFGTLQRFVEEGSLQPDSQIFQVFHSIKSNQVQLSQNSDDE